MERGLTVCTNLNSESSPQLRFLVGDYATFGSGARLAGRVTVGDGAYIGSGALIRQSLTVGAWALVGLGAVVLEDVPSAEVWVGVPARRLRKVDLPADLVVAP